MSDDIRPLVVRAIGQTEAIIESIRPEQVELPTPCPQWTVRNLVEHVVGSDLRNFVVAARGEKVDWAAPPDPLDSDWAVQASTAAASLRAAWERSAAPTEGDNPHQQITELTVHNWDLLMALGRDGDVIDDELAEHALAWSRDKLLPEYRGEAVGPEVPVPADAPAYARLVGWFGRDPSWRPPS
jgi:uncharacterized protein (TIGR03086 family)